MNKFLLTLAILLIYPLSISASDSNVYQDLKERSLAHYDEARDIRHRLHQHPESCFTEKETSKYISQYLRKLGLEVQTNIGGKYGIKAILKGNRERPAVGIRADMDALPLNETTGLTWASKRKGIMHACGHDVHMTNGLIAAKLLSEMKNEIPGTIVFLFQPCEEGVSDGTTGGAAMMIKEGVLENPHIDALFGLHVAPGVPIGEVAVKAGPVLASNAAVDITIHGKSSHGAFPEEGIDAITAAAAAITKFQSIGARTVSPSEKAVFSIGTIQGGSKSNIIADRVDIRGIVRTFSFDTERTIEKKIRRVLDDLVGSMGITYDLKFVRTDTYVKNDARLNKMTHPILVEIFGKEHVLAAKPLMGSEDFAQYSHNVPSLFFFLGAGDAGSLHNPKFAPDDEILKYGALLLSSAAIGYLNHQQSQ